MYIIAKLEGFFSRVLCEVTEDWIFPVQFIGSSSHSYSIKRGEALSKNRLIDSQPVPLNIIEALCGQGDCGIKVALTLKEQKQFNQAYLVIIGYASIIDSIMEGGHELIVKGKRIKLTYDNVTWLGLGDEIYHIARNYSFSFLFDIIEEEGYELDVNITYTAYTRHRYTERAEIRVKRGGEIELLETTREYQREQVGNEREGIRDVCINSINLVQRRTSDNPCK